MAQSQNGRITADITVRGVVQGVGFRPFVARLADRYCLTGFVKNESGHVEIKAQGPEASVRGFLRELTDNPPDGARIESIEYTIAPPDAAELDGAVLGGFVIAESGRSDFVKAMIAPDIAVCEDCRRELFTPGDPRYLNPFISCVSCGPRYSIIESLPYDRETTVMNEFPMCELCAHQYHDPSDRRCHAQTVCCNSCGPELQYEGRDAAISGKVALGAAITTLKDGGIVAVKGIGGYHFACSPYETVAVARLRELKGREDKPFAVMFPDMEDIKKRCHVGALEEALLLSPARPIVLLNKTTNDFGEGVCRRSRFLGAFLPYTPIQLLLLRDTGPLIMTSANVSSLPIIKDDEEMQSFFERTAPLNGVLTHNRRILRRLDDSVVAVVNGEAQLIRRARGYAPLPVDSEALSDCPTILACGAQQKSAVAFTAGSYAYMSAELGDLDSEETIAVYRETIDDMKALFHLEPAAVACDHHPDYASTHYAVELGLFRIPVQHHFAHIASVMAEHHISDRVIGVAFDGTGYGTDGTVWGGEFLYATPDGFTRAGHLKDVTLLGSDASVYQNWKTALCYLADAGIDGPVDAETKPGYDKPGLQEREKLVRTALKHNVNTIRSSSMGRLFDAVSAMLGICMESTYEGQGAVELENAVAVYAAQTVEEPLPYLITRENGELVADMAPCIRAIWAERAGGGNAGLLASRFHLTVCRLIMDICTRLREDRGINKICLSGGVFQNRILLEKTVPALQEAGFEVYLNEKVPPNDGGIALGQAFAASHILRNTDREGATNVCGCIGAAD